MPPFRKPTLVTLRRKGPNQPWGFRLAGGAEVQQPFRIQKVSYFGLDDWFQLSSYLLLTISYLSLTSSYLFALNYR